MATENRASAGISASDLNRKDREFNGPVPVDV
jgi:hypothetical protein